MSNSTKPPQTPLQRQLDQLGGQIVGLGALASGAVFGIGWLRGFGLWQMFRSALSLSVAAVPEGLPAVATTALAMNVEEMRRRGVLVRRLDAIETMAAVTVICFDKTGTLTRNQMRVAALWSSASPVEAAGPNQLGGHSPRTRWALEIAALCSEAEPTVAGDPSSGGSATETALLAAALEHGIQVGSLREQWPRLAVRHRTESDRFMATFHRAGAGRALVAVKGSPPDVLNRCDWDVGLNGQRQPLTPTARLAANRINTDMAEQGLRVLALATGVISSPPLTRLEVRELTFLGLVGLADPLRNGMRELVSNLHRAGIRTVLITGDQSATARSIAMQVGLCGENLLQVVDAGRPDAFNAGQQAHVFARVSPEQKLLIVRALQAAGEHTSTRTEPID